MTLHDYPSYEGSYGGNQAWWGKDTVGHRYGCGVIAATDFLIYKGYIDKVKTKKAYIEQASMMWPVIKPNTGIFFRMPYVHKLVKFGIGVYSIRRMIQGIHKFFEIEGVDFSYKILKNTQKDSVIDFIKTSLSKGIPVQLLQYYEVGSQYNFHWVTVTAINEMTDGHTVLISTWGIKKEIQYFESLWTKKSLMDFKFCLSIDIKSV